MEGKVALVTGGGSGIGQATARAFAQAGAALVIAGRGHEPADQTVQMITAAGGRARFIQTDVSHGDSVAALIETTMEEYGRLDYACISAGIVGALALLADQTDQAFDDIIGINLKGVWLSMKYEIRAMREVGGGVIVNISSVNAERVAPDAPIYSASKAGVVALTKAAAIGYAEVGIRVNAINAGFIWTAMQETALVEATGHDAEMAREELAAQLPLKRVGRPEDVAHAVLWLCSDHAAFVTGQVIGVEGGVLAT